MVIRRDQLKNRAIRIIRGQKFVQSKPKLFNDQTLVSVVMAYYNRRPQFLRTLESIAQTAHSKVEIVVCDDGSNNEHRIHLNQYRFPVIIERVEPEDKWWINPCLSYNRAISRASGGLIILQNPECYHCGDLIRHAVETIRDQQYLVYPCLALGPGSNLGVSIPHGKRRQFPKWYHHPIWNPTYYHFTSAISAHDLKRLNGFDPIFANGIGWDDDEFLFRARRQLELVPLGQNAPFVKHQYHENFFKVNQAEDHAKFVQNRLLFDITTKGGPSVQIMDRYDWYTHMPVLRSLLDVFGPDVALEFGAGVGSTELLHTRVQQFTMVENNPEWYATMLGKCPPRDGFRYALHYLGDDIDLSTRTACIAPSLMSSIKEYYALLVSQLPQGNCRLLMIDQYTCCRCLALEFYSAFDIILFHDCEPRGWQDYNYGSVTINQDYCQYVLKSPASWTGLIIKKSLNHRLEAFEVAIGEHISAFAEQYGLGKTDFSFERIK